MHKQTFHTIWTGNL